MTVSSSHIQSTLIQRPNEWSGNALVSTGDSGKAHLWRRDLNGDFLEFAETGRL